MITVWHRPPADNTASASDFVLAPHVSLVLSDDGTARLLDMGGGFFALPAIGAQMLQGTLERGSAATVQELAQRYQVSAARVQADLDSLLQQLQKQRLLRRGRQWGLDLILGLALLLVPCLYLVRSLSFGWVRTVLVLTLTKLSLVCFGWARTVTVWQRCLGRPDPRSAAVDEPTARSLDQAVQKMAAGHPLPMACKERALSCWVLLRWAGVPASLVVGLQFFPLIGHCWCEVGALVLSDYSDNCELYTPVIRYA